jgi:formamidopyrimidine-DNA glycosylase
VPELPEVESVRIALRPAMEGARFNTVVARRPDLRAALPRHFSARLTGAAVLRLGRRGKYLVADLSSGESLVMHLGMSGSFRIEPVARVEAIRAHDHVVFHMSSGARVTFNDPRRFGMMEVVPTAALSAHRAFRLGPEPLAPEFDAARLARLARGRKTTLKAMLCDQRLIAGLGNIYACEALHHAGLAPRRAASTIATRSGAPRPSARRLVVAIKKVLLAALQRSSAEDSATDVFRVYDREGHRCRRRGCQGVVRRIVQAGRSTFYCPVCQR